MIALCTVHNLVLGLHLVCNIEYVKSCRLSGHKCIIVVKNAEIRHFAENKTTSERGE
jgi:hypothetical protein